MAIAASAPFQYSTIYIPLIYLHIILIILIISTLLNTSPPIQHIFQTKAFHLVGNAQVVKCLLLLYGRVIKCYLSLLQW